MENLSLKMFKGKVVHFIGIGGISMSSLALMLQRHGAIVQGSDIQENDEVEVLKERGVNVFKGHDAKNLKDVCAVCYSSAIHDDNPELVEAKKKGLIVVKRAELLGLISQEYKTVIAIAGSHGKTTTTAMISEMFVRAEMNPTLHIGGVDNLVGANCIIGDNDIFVVEACEYKDNYLHIKPDIAVTLNVDADHLDYFGSLEGVKESFLKFANGVNTGGINIVSKDDENSEDLRNLHNCMTFGFNKKADIYASNIKEYKPCYYSFDVVFFRKKLGNIKLNIMGKHNILNSLATVIVGISCMIDFESIKFAIENYQGVKRRCEKIGEVNGAEVFHDYAHHPKQIEAMIKVGKEFVFKTRGKIIVVFEPHTYSRTKFLLDEFAKSFEGADECIFAPAYSARENLAEGFEADVLAKKVREKVAETFYIETYDQIVLKIKSVAKKGDVVLILGAGTIEKLANKVREN